MDNKWIFIDTLSEKFRRGYQKWNLQVQRKTSGTSFFCKVILLIFFGPWAKNSRDFVMKISASSSKLGSHFQSKLSGENLLENLQFVIFLNIERKKFKWLSKKSQRGFQAAFYLSMGTIRRKKLWKVFASFVDFFRIISGIWAVKVWRAFQTAFSVSIENFLKKNCFGKQRKFFIIFRHWAEVLASCLLFWPVC